MEPAYVIGAGMTTFGILDQSLMELAGQASFKALEQSCCLDQRFDHLIVGSQNPDEFVSMGHCRAEFVALGIVDRPVHVSFCVHRVVQPPVCDRGAGVAMSEIIGPIGQSHTRGVPSVAASCDPYPIFVHKGFITEPFDSLNQIMHLPLSQIAVHQGHSIFSKVA